MGQRPLGGPHCEGPRAPSKITPVAFRLGTSVIATGEVSARLQKQRPCDDSGNLLASRGESGPRDAFWG